MAAKHGSKKASLHRLPPACSPRVRGCSTSSTGTPPKRLYISVSYDHADMVKPFDLKARLLQRTSSLARLAARRRLLARFWHAIVS
jgi:hypothetical protein